MRVTVARVGISPEQQQKPLLDLFARFLIIELAQKPGYGSDLEQGSVKGARRTDHTENSPQQGTLDFVPHTLIDHTETSGQRPLLVDQAVRGRRRSGEGIPLTHPKRSAPRHSFRQLPNPPAFSLRHLREPWHRCRPDI